MSSLSLRAICSLFIILTATLTHAESLYAVFDFSNPTTLSPQISETTELNDIKFSCGDINITFSKGPEGTAAPTLTFNSSKGKYVKLRKYNRITIEAINNASIISSVFVKGYDNNEFNSSAFSILNSNEHINKFTKDGEHCFSIPGGDQTIENISDALQYISKIKVEYEVADTPVKIEDMPEGLECKKFDVARVIKEGINYVLVSGNYVATGKLNENGHLNVVRFTSENGEINIPMQYAFNLTGCDNDAFYISNNENKFLAADAAGHFSLTENELEATAWEILTGSDGDIKISEAVAVSRAAGKSVMFSEQEGGFGRYDIDDASAQAPVLYAYADNTTSIITEIADEMENQAEYFDLRGNRVDINHAANGIYICRNGKRVTKVAILR